MLDCHTHYTNKTKNEKFIATANKDNWLYIKDEIIGLGHLPFTFFDDYKLLEEKIKENKLYYLGEWGLDKKSNLDISTQEDILNNIVKIARKYNRFICLHNNGYVDRIIRTINSNKDVNFLWHGYKYNKSVASQACKFNNCVLSIGRHFFKKNIDIKLILDYPILFETDWDNKCKSYNIEYNNLLENIKFIDNVKEREINARKILKI